MPFTFSHPAAAIVVRPAIRRGWLPLAPFVIGAMAPDFEYVARLEPWARVGHTWPGVVTFTLPVALVVLVAWVAFAGDAVRDLAGLAPAGAAADARTRSPRWWIASVGALTLGIATHVAWDGFTHWDGYAARWFPILAQPVSPSVPRFFWANVLQHTSTVIGGAAVVSWYLRQLQSSPADHPLAAPWRRRALTMLGAATLGLALWNAPRAGTMTDPSPLKLAAGRFVVGGMAGLALGIVCYSWWWRATRHNATSR